MKLLILGVHSTLLCSSSWMCSGTTLNVSQGTYMVPEIEPESIKHKARGLPIYNIQSPVPHNTHSWGPNTLVPSLLIITHYSQKFLLNPTLQCAQSTLGGFQNHSKEDVEQSWESNQSHIITELYNLVIWATSRVLRNHLPQCWGSYAASEIKPWWGTCKARALTSGQSLWSRTMYFLIFSHVPWLTKLLRAEFSPGSALQPITLNVTF